ncbi:hypothetical protein [Clavibacter michiganensis]|uniref:Uncharacterized protein n=1 Tax=Clavibacter michiganensis subsp. michiganensis TaxID=33013 RepID=A0A251XMQ0_CLAMM|nr:hypothetical protein [Clavibacter michiganensis]MBE3079575.1 hypothetical protein [Clavibacter michiganensis subsp. michiganensis]MDO4029845.1 hypothetical protein [Clavibacter michiganensis]MWJ11936.1 hypothetical protein [Clavibacter michiganensis subsp. michiganensis]MWJ48180.1 hypothetical protein [Clavibacter michiganensis subsp. michiganensis]OUD87737.1 hypothetical protein BC477_07075 [Clavibacter michiganensis subsp. michiganensis]
MSEGVCEGGLIHLSLLHRSRWITYGTAIAIGLAGVAGLVVGNPRGWIPVGIAVLAVLFQRLVSRDARRAQEAGTDPRDTVG